MTEPRKRDWSKFWIHFACGAFLGAISGFIAWGRSSDALSISIMPAVLHIGGGALVLGIMAGLAADKEKDEISFWRELIDTLRR